ncbi:RNA polymerase sigma-70 factor [Pseudobacter ginsenosidimutans]|nr:RNA polymerase sigma-70 factor [Pseudobacter ginsenosidimutans]
MILEVNHYNVHCLAVTPSYQEKELLHRLSEGDKQAFTTLFDIYWDNIYSVALVLTKSPQLAEDTVQEIFLKVWNKREELASVDRFDNYLFIMARNHIFSEFRRLKIRQEHIALLQAHFDSALQTPEDQMLYKESTELIEKAVARLAPQQQQVYRLSREQGLTHEAIAATLGISVHTVRNHMVRAIKGIRDYLMNQDNTLLLTVALIRSML